MRLTTLLLTFLISTSAHATFLKAPDGSRISEGDSVAKLKNKLGYPADKDYKTVCLKGREDKCKKWGNIEIWYYEVNGLYWTIKIETGKIFDLEWSR